MKPIGNIFNSDIRIVYPGSCEYSHSNFCEIKWPDGRYDYLRAVVMNPELSAYLESALGGEWGPVHMKCAPAFDYESTGNWLVSFYANAILANRDYIMDGHEFSAFVNGFDQ